MHIRTTAAAMLSCLPIIGAAQISAPQADYRDSTAYSRYSQAERVRQDSIFVFFAPKLGSLTAASPLTVPRLIRYQWQKLDLNALPAQDYADIVTEETTSASIRNNLSNGCYRVLMDTTPDGSNYYPLDTFRVWVFVDTFALCGITITYDNDVCGNAELTGRYRSASGAGGCSYDPNFRYSYRDLYQPSAPERTFPSYGNYIAEVKWTPSRDIYAEADGFVSEDPSWDTRIQTRVPKPLWNAAYRLKVTNCFGNTADTVSDTLLAYSVFAKVHIDAGTEKNGATEWSGMNAIEEGKKYEAPLHLKAKSVSVNAAEGSSYCAEWFFYGKDSLPERQVLHSQTSLSPSDVITLPSPYPPGKYPVKMRITNHYGCTDSTEFTLTVEDFLIAEDNFTQAFSPSSSTGTNLYFKIKDPDKVRSVLRFEINVFNRYGQRVFDSNDLEFKWDGRISGTDGYAPDGVYFYTVSAEGLDDSGKQVRKRFSGNVHLFGSIKN